MPFYNNELGKESRSVVNQSQGTITCSVIAPLAAASMVGVDEDVMESAKNMLIGSDGNFKAHRIGGNASVAFKALGYQVASFNSGYRSGWLGYITKAIDKKLPVAILIQWTNLTIMRGQSEIIGSKSSASSKQRNIAQPSSSTRPTPSIASKVVDASHTTRRLENPPNSLASPASRSEELAEIAPPKIIDGSVKYDVVDFNSATEAAGFKGHVVYLIGHEGSTVYARDQQNNHLLIEFSTPTWISKPYKAGKNMRRCIVTEIDIGFKAREDITDIRKLTSKEEPAMPSSSATQPQSTSSGATKPSASATKPQSTSSGATKPSAWKH